MAKNPTGTKLDAGQTRKQLLARFVREVWDLGREEAVATYLAASYRIHHDPGDPWDGQELDLLGFKERLRLSRAPFPDQKFDIQGLYADGDAVVMIWLWTATHLGDFPGFPATGRVIRMSGATAYLFNANDRLTGHWQITDRLGVYRQLQANKGSA
jgi:predicted ester cyclase